MFQVTGAQKMNDRVAQIRDRLASAFSPDSLEVLDESHRHIGHEGARDGRGHFRVRMVAAAFSGKPLLARHRDIYDALGSLMETDIHALAIEARTPAEQAQS